MNPFNSHLGKELEFLPYHDTVNRPKFSLQQSPFTWYKHQHFPQDKGKSKQGLETGKDGTKNFLTEMESKLIFPKLWGRGRVCCNLKDTVFFIDEKVLELCCTAVLV